MTANTVKDGQKWPIRSPGTVQIFAFAPCANISKTVTPDLKAPGKSKLMYLDASGCNHQRLGGSAWLQTLNQLGDEAPDAPPAEFLARFFAAVQHLVKRGLLLSYHDRSDGGLITCLLEMAFSGNCGLELMLRQNDLKAPFMDTFLLNQELGAVIEYLPKHEDAIRNILKRYGLSGNYHVLGQTSKSDLIVVVSGAERLLLHEHMAELRAVWRETSFQLYEFQANPETVEQERKNTFIRTKISFPLTFKPRATSAKILKSKNKPKVAVIRELGTNGDQELAAALSLAGFEVVDVHMTDLISGKASLRSVQMTAWPGGFGFGDVMDAAKGLAGVCKFNPNVAQELRTFLARPDTCSFGPCNGDQFMALYGFVPWQGIPPEKQPRFIVNTSEIFESRLVNVRILESDSIFLKGMAGSVLPVIVAHHEGRVHFSDQSILDQVLQKNLAPIRYLGDDGKITEAYPFNPNGSPKGIAGLSSQDGRHLAMMPHPERLFTRWQNNVYWPPEWNKYKVGPWLQLFQNAAEWCRTHR
jgi:phosphoribosylformylglycinamidine synthase